MSDTSNALPRYAAASTDLTVGFGASSLFLDDSPRDPWYSRCFISICDAAINHPLFYYPLPTGNSSYNDPTSLPVLVAALQSNGVISPLAGSTADEYAFLQSDLAAQFDYFCRWARQQGTNLRKWLALHFTSEVRSKHFLRLRHEVQRPISDFWEQRSADVSALSERTGTSTDQLRYAFDVMYRGLQYADMTVGMPYFNHPIRDPLMPSSTVETSRFSAYSWGRVLFRAIQDGRISKDPQLIAANVALLRDLVSRPDRPCNWYDLRTLKEQEQRNRLFAVAADARLHTQVRTVLKKETTELAAAVALGLEFAGMHSIAIAIDACVLVAEKWQGGVPSLVAKIPLLRAAVEIPGLLAEENSPPNRRVQSTPASGSG